MRAAGGGGVMGGAESLAAGVRVWDEARNCGAVVESVGTNPDYPDRVLVRYDRVLSERMPMFGVEVFGRDWVLPERLDVVRCDCGAPARRRVLVSTTPGSADGRLFWLYLCGDCHESEGWAESDLAGERDMWELFAGSDPDA